MLPKMLTPGQIIRTSSHFLLSETPKREKQPTDKPKREKSSPIFSFDRTGPPYHELLAGDDCESTQVKAMTGYVLSDRREIPAVPRDVEFQLFPEILRFDVKFQLCPEIPVSPLHEDSSLRSLTGNLDRKPVDFASDSIYSSDRPTIQFRLQPYIFPPKGERAACLRAVQSMRTGHGRGGLLDF